jgi:hypothetical protein
MRGTGVDPRVQDQIVRVLGPRTRRAKVQVARAATALTHAPQRNEPLVSGAAPARPESGRSGRSSRRSAPRRIPVCLPGRPPLTGNIKNDSDGPSSAPAGGPSASSGAHVRSGGERRRPPTSDLERAFTRDTLRAGCLAVHDAPPRTLTMLDSAWGAGRLCLPDVRPAAPSFRLRPGSACTAARRWPPREGQRPPRERRRGPPRRPPPDLRPPRHPQRKRSGERSPCCSPICPATRR